MNELTAHGNEGVIGRLGLNPLETVEWLKTAKETTYKEATQVASIFNHLKGNKYYTAPDPMIPGDHVVLIVREKRIVTIMTKITNSFYGVEAEMVNGHRVIRTLDGGVIYDQGNWTRKMRKKNQKIYPRKRM